MIHLFGEVFYWIFNMSLTASFFGLLVLLLRKIKRIPRRFSVLLWIIPFVRMCIPIGLNSHYSLMSFLSRFTTKTVTVYQPTDDVAFSMMNSVMAANAYFPITYKVPIFSHVFAVAAWIWLTGVAVILIALACVYIKTMQELKGAKHLKENVFLSEKVQSPAVYGIFHPRIVLPKNYGEEELRYVLLHERTHVHRKDNLWRLLGLVAAAVHWFNPLAWLCLKLFLTDLELACVVAVLSGLPDVEQKGYAMKLLSGAESESMLVSAFGGANLKTRISHIVTYRRMTAASAAGFVILLIALLFVTLTNAG